MNKIKSALSLTALLLSLALCLTSCGFFRPLPLDNDESQQPTVFLVEDYGVQVDAPAGWEKTDAENLDLQLYNASIGSYMSMYAYADIDLAQGETVEDLFASQTASLLDSRENVEQVEETTRESADGKTIMTTLYSAERDGNKNYYRFYMLDFENSDKMAWILFTGLPSTIQAHQSELRALVDGIHVVQTDATSSQTPVEV